jgi:hypothetical protein
MEIARLYLHLSLYWLLNRRSGHQALIEDVQFAHERMPVHYMTRRSSDAGSRVKYE